MLIKWKLNGEQVSASERVYDRVRELEDLVHKHEQGRCDAAIKRQSGPDLVGCEAEEHF